jgi:hypothetical protein
MDLKSNFVTTDLIKNLVQYSNFMKDVVGNTTAEANVMCQKIVPHE